MTKIILHIVLILIIMGSSSIVLAEKDGVEYNTDKSSGFMSRLRHGFVRFVWKAIDLMGDSQAKKAVLPQGVEYEENLTYFNDNHEKHLLDVYYPEGLTGQMPVIIYIHGGGFVAGDKRQMKQYCMTLAKQGYVVFNINYRLAPEHTITSQITDVLTAMAWVLEHSATYGGDRSQIFLAGESAGAYLASLTAALLTNPDFATKLDVKPAFSGEAIRGVLLFSGLYDLQTGAKRKFPGIRGDIEMFLGTGDLAKVTDIEKYSVLKSITADFPATFISSGEVDPLHQETVEMVKVLEQLGVEHQTLLFDKREKKAFHAYQQQLNLHTAQLCLERVAEFLSRIVF